MPKKTLRFGFHDFLNAQPVLQPLRHYAREAGLEMVIDTPAALARRLDAGELDLAMVPSIEYLRRDDSYQLLPGLAIASRGPVGTVLLATQVPLREIKTLALDERSRTSVTLLRLLFGQKLSSEVKYHQSQPDPREMLATHDAALIIGDQALNLKISGKGPAIYDLSEEWHKRTGKTFVHAVVAVSADVAIDQKLIGLIQKAKTEGQTNLEKIAQEQAQKLGIDFAVCKDYLTNKILYNLGEEEMAGLTHFRNLCQDAGLLQQTKT